MYTSNLSYHGGGFNSVSNFCHVAFIKQAVIIAVAENNITVQDYCVYTLQRRNLHTHLDLSLNNVSCRYKGCPLTSIMRAFTFGKSVNELFLQSYLIFHWCMSYFLLVQKEYIREVQYYFAPWIQ
jgi:hypothetical protein